MWAAHGSSYQEVDANSLHGNTHLIWGEHDAKGLEPLLVPVQVKNITKVWETLGEAKSVDD